MRKVILASVLVLMTAIAMAFVVSAEEVSVGSVCNSCERGKGISV